ncbi:MAG: thiamine phosphate synthase [Nitrospinae bacterium]|nr:thiamine phosphate synthase [Nitrospinota bacterium]
MEPSTLDPLYLITDRNAPPSDDLLGALDTALIGGVRFLQYREKDLPYAERLELGREVASLANEHGARLIVNGDPELADALGADGVHLGKGTVSVSAVRAEGYSGLIGYSAHSGEEAARAFAQGADFATLSPVFPTRSKFSSGPVLGLEKFERECEVAGGPVYALGGVGAENASVCLERGARGVALIGAVLAAEDPARAAREVRAALGV